MLCSETWRLCWHLHKWSIIKAWFSSAYYSSLSSLHSSSLFWLCWTSQRYVPLASSCRSNRKTCCRDDFDLWITIDITCEDVCGDDHSIESKGITSTRIPFWGKIWSFGRSLGTNLEHHKLTFSLHWLTILSPILWPPPITCKIPAHFCTTLHCREYPLPCQTYRFLSWQLSAITFDIGHWWLGKPLFEMCCFHISPASNVVAQGQKLSFM